MKRGLFLSTLLGVLLPFTCGNAADSEIKSFQVRVGTLEIGMSPSERFTFRWGNEKEVFDLSVQALLSASGSTFPGLPNLKEIGFLTVSGKTFEYGKLAKNIFIDRFVKDHPGEVGEALIFEGFTGEKLEVRIKGLTSVCRVDLVLQDSEITLWKNLPEKAGPEAKGGKK